MSWLTILFIAAFLAGVFFLVAPYVIAWYILWRNLDAHWGSATDDESKSE